MGKYIGSALVMEPNIRAVSTSNSLGVSMRCMNVDKLPRPPPMTMPTMIAPGSRDNQPWLRWVVIVLGIGAALGLGSGVTWIFPLIAIAVFAAILVMSRKLGSRVWAIGLGMLLGGLFRAVGQVDVPLAGFSQGARMALVVTGGVHGNEVCGPVAIRRLKAELRRVTEERDILKKPR